jgi:hypothetical protein
MTAIDDLVKEQKTTNLLLKEILKRVDAMRNEQVNSKSTHAIPCAPKVMESAEKTFKPKRNLTLLRFKYWLKVKVGKYKPRTPHPIPIKSATSGDGTIDITLRDPKNEERNYHPFRYYRKKLREWMREKN